jgi:hypothetical protein
MAMKWAVYHQGATAGASTPSSQVRHAVISAHSSFKFREQLYIGCVSSGFVCKYKHTKQPSEARGGSSGTQ